MKQVFALLGIFVIFAWLFLPSRVSADDWSQDAHDAARTGYSFENPDTGSKWSFAWFWTSPANAAPPREGRSITGGGLLYFPAGASGLYALNLSTGTQAWHVNGTFNAAPAYASGFVYAGSADSHIYKINATTGATAASFTGSGPFNKAALLVGNNAYFGTDSGTFYKINTATMTSLWQYVAGANLDTPASYSTRGILVFGTSDLYLHAVNDADGTRLWRVKPSPNNPGTYSSSGWNSFNWGWPVIAEKHGLVLMRQQLPDGNDTGAKFAGPNAGKFALTNSENRTWLQQNPAYQNLFALDLSNGTQKFTPAVGFGSVEDSINGVAVAEMGTQPVVKVWPNGDEVVYIPFRSGQSPCGYDARWSGHMGEMVLDSTTVPGLVAGDLRFIKMNRDCQQGGESYVHVIDEETPITMAGNSLYNAHWGASEGVAITDRSVSLGLTYLNPIATTNLPVIIRRLSACASYTAATHKASCGLTLYQDGRYWSGPGWVMYYNTMDPPGPKVTTAYSAGFLPRYTYAASGYLVVEGNGGDLLVLNHGGASPPTPTVGPTAVPTMVPTAVPTLIPVLGDANGDRKVDGIDYIIWLNHYSQTVSGPANGDFNNDGKVDGIDYVTWLTHYGL